MQKYQPPFPVQQLQLRLERRFPILAKQRPVREVEGMPIPVYEGRPLLGHVFELMRDPLALCLDTMRTHGEMVRVPLSIHEIVFVTHPEAYERAFIRNMHAYKRGFSHKILRKIIGLGMLTAEHEEWLPTRQAAAPRLTTRSREDMLPIIHDHMDHWEQRWDRYARSGETRELVFDFMCLTSQIAFDVLYGYRMRDVEGEQFTRDFVDIQDDLFKRLRLPLIPPRPASILALRRIEALAERLRVSPHAGELAAQAMTMIATVPENPSNALGWAIYELARQPQHLERIRAELTEGESSRHIQNVIHEILRLYPGGWIYERIADEDDVVAGYHVPEGSCLVFSPFATHRNAKYWPEPDRFMPERFDGDVMRELTPFTFVPFSVGPRRCVGDRYTTHIVTEILTRFTKRYNIVLDPAEKGEMWPMFTLRSRTGILAKLERV